MALIYKIILFCLLDLATRNSLAESKKMQVKIQSVYTGKFLNVQPSSMPPIVFRTDDTVTWQIDWDAGISNRTTIRKLLPTGWHIISVIHNQTFLEMEQSPPLDDAGDWIIFSNYSSALGRYYHKFRSSTAAPTLCINTPFSDSGIVYPSMSPCSGAHKQQDFLISYAE